MSKLKLIYKLEMIKIEDYSKNNKKHISAIEILPVFIMIAICSLSIGYAALNSINLKISGTLGLSIPRRIHIKEVVDEHENEIDGFYNDTILNSTITLEQNNSTSTKTYKITVQNNTNFVYEYINTIADKENPQSYSNPNITYTISGISENELIQPNTEKEFYITFKYEEDVEPIADNTLTSTIRFVFENSIGDFDLSSIVKGQAFNLGEVNFDSMNQTFYVELDVNSISSSAINENLISIGQAISEWEVPNTIQNGVTLHIYYPSNDKKIIISPLIQGRNHIQFKQEYSKLESQYIMKIAFNSNGLYINGKKIIDRSGVGTETNVYDKQNPMTVEEYLQIFFTNWSSGILNIEIGSEQGINRSNAEYKAVEIYRSLMTPEQMEELTTVRNTEPTEPIEPTEPTTPIDEITFTDILEEAYPAGGEKFYFTIPDYKNMKHQTLYFEMDVSNVDTNLENIISIGHEIDKWTPIISDRANIHLYYPDGSGNIILAVAMNGNTFKQWRIPISVLDIENGKIKMAVNYNGIYINGKKIAARDGVINNIASFSTVSSTLSDRDFLLAAFDRFSSDEGVAIEVGSQEGSTRSDATYDNLKLYDGLLSDEDMATLTSWENSNTD